MNRRHFLLGSTSMIALGGATIGALWPELWPALWPRAARSETLLSAFEDVRGEQYVGGMHLESKHVFGARVPMRAHGCAIDPSDPMRVVYFARRPGTQAFEYRRDTHSVRVVCETPEGRHFAGHGLFSPDGAWLFTPEHDYANVRGILAVRDARTFQLVSEIDTGGIDPHEIAWSQDHRQLIVANGGILTHPRSYRRKLNIATMDPSLSIIDATSGRLVEQWRLPHHLLSIRHLAPATDGRVAIGLQYEGQAEQAPAIAAVYVPKIGLQLLPLPSEAQLKCRGYVASIALSERLDTIIAACPYGKGVACWSLRDGAFRTFIEAQETYGVSRLADGALIASQRDGSLYTLRDGGSRSSFVTVDRESPIRWDDHWTSVDS